MITKRVSSDDNFKSAMTRIVKRNQAQDRALADYIAKVGTAVGQEHHVKFLSCMQWVVIDYRVGRNADDLAKEIIEHG